MVFWYSSVLDFTIDETTGTQFDFLNGESVINFETDSYVQESNIQKHYLLIML